MKKFITATLILSFLLLSLSGKSQVKLPPIFSNNMVLQKGLKIPVWGWAAPGEKITVTIDKFTMTTRAGKDGKWKLSLNEMTYGGPYKMVIKGKNIQVLENVMIGEVWLCSGQSNMGFPVKGAKNAKDEIAAANYPNIRHFAVRGKMAKVPQENLSAGNWEICSPETVGGFSAVGFFFARNLYNHLNIPIGIIKSSYAGTNIETWLSTQIVVKDPDLSPLLEKLDTANLNAPKLTPSDYPTLLFNGMINPLIPYAIKGVIWYQGESNAFNAQQYRRFLPNMIKDWRSHWNQGDFPFLTVQLPNYKGPGAQPSGSLWAELREAQAESLQLPNTGLTTTIDVGESDDIHPKDKQTVGYRLFLSARKVAYGEDIVYSGPSYSDMKIEGNKIYIRFNHVGSKGLDVKDKYGYIKEFSIAGEDQRFYWAKASLIDANTVIVSSPEVNNPVAVRYGWAENPYELNLYNMEGLPAVPFRTDKWKGRSK